MGTRPNSDNRWALAACTVAVAAAFGGPVAGAEPQAVQSIQRYCQTSWRNAGIDRQEWPDCTQQAVTDLIERISTDRLATAIGEHESLERRELNRAVWRIIQRWRRAPRHKPWDDHVRGHVPATSAWEEVTIAARNCLSDRQFRILNMLRDGWKVQEIAEELDMPAARVSDEKYKAVGKLKKYVQANA